ncbi:DUF177 domain-containing protein [Tissierella sp.]|uniref:YceD family protein n=1 Tax=Tissierella sp. TaxID=41274 RepID=UPI00285DFFF9|nr:DUF177 domain-containing protein [Tissierella sp.]MDR7856369.1 DUF177 domain-containing protein [Tissierella sp.]
MKIDLSSFLDEPNESFHFEGNLEIKRLDLGGRDIVIVDPIQYEGEIFNVDGEKTVDIRIAFTYSEVCNRCLAPTINKIKTILSGKLIKGKEEIQFEDEGYEEILYYDTDFFDPKEYVLNQVVLSLPMKSLCSSDCKGLCPKCGADLNNTVCDCIHENIDPRLEKLKNLFPKN